MFNKILIVHVDNQTHVTSAVIRKVGRLLNKNDRQYVLLRIDELREDFFANVDLVITIGGDGTFTRSANFIKSGYILGINSEPEKSEGALTSLMNNEIKSLESILDGNFSIIKRQRAEVRFNGNLLHKAALNEIYVGTSMQFHASRYIIKYRGRTEEQRSSGVIIATGTGSKSWYKSAGGRPFDCSAEMLKFLVREPYRGDRVYKPSILHGEIKKGERIIFESTRDYGGIIALDNEMYDFNRGSIIEAGLSDNVLNVICRQGSKN